MTRWLLNSFPTWAIALIVVGTLVAFTLAALWAIRRWLPMSRRSEHNDFAGVMAGVIAAIYGVFLAIAIVALYQELLDAEQQTQVEAAAMGRIVRNSAELRPAEGARIRVAVRQYRNEVIGPEWTAMRDGRESVQAWRFVDDIYGTLHGYRPRNAAEQSFFDATLTAVNDMVDARRERLHGSQASLPSLFMILLIGGAVLTIGFTLIFGVTSSRMETVMGVSLATLLGFCLLVAFVLDHPYSGDVTVSKDPYLAGSLANL